LWGLANLTPTSRLGANPVAAPVTHSQFVSLRISTIFWWSEQAVGPRLTEEPRIEEDSGAWNWAPRRNTPVHEFKLITPSRVKLGKVSGRTFKDRRPSRETWPLLDSSSHSHFSPRLGGQFTYFSRAQINTSRKIKVQASQESTLPVASSSSFPRETQHRTDSTQPHHQTDHGHQPNAGVYPSPFRLRAQ
jgi:hypothetical protein